jgi:hypothetical protein
MHLAQVVRDPTVPGLARHSLACRACGERELRLVFAHEARSETACAVAPAEQSEASARRGAWPEAVEKVRQRQAVLARASATGASTTVGAATGDATAPARTHDEFDRLWESLARAPRPAERHDRQRLPGAATPVPLAGGTRAPSIIPSEGAARPGSAPRCETPAGSAMPARGHSPKRHGIPGIWIPGVWARAAAMLRGGRRTASVRSDAMLRIKADAMTVQPLRMAGTGSRRARAAGSRQGPTTAPR